MGQRLFYLLAVIVIIGIGILSRKLSGIPLFIGDSLYAMMVYAGIRMLFLKPFRLSAVAALLVCFGIEFSQLLHYDGLTALRHTTFGHYALGQGFLWSDLLAYTVGIAVALSLDLWRHKKTGKVISGL